MDAATQTATNPKANIPPKLEDQAATAALYVTNAHKQPKSNFPLDADNKLSSAGAATSLRYASPRDLPSFPTVGVTNTESSAGAAASLANANHKSFEYWRPESSAPASKAAMLAKDYKPAPLWHPEMSAAGSKAALIAANHGGNVNIWRPEATQAGNSAAGQAMRNKTLSPQIDYGYTADGSSKALMAATGAMAGRKRSGSSPTVTSLYPDAANSAANALNAATVANRPLTKKPVLGSSGGYGLLSKDATRIHNAAITNLGREMYTSHPPVAPEVEEKNRQESLRAAAISMAKQMYDIQQKTLESAAGVQRSDSHHAASSVHRRRQSSVSSTTDDTVRVPPQYPNLQQAAQKLAAERLAKLGQDEDAAYRDYYGAHAPIQSRLSVRGRLRRRASSDGGIPESDEARSQQIRSQMSIFNDKLAQVDAKKRQKDRDSLLAAAQRNVAARMHGLDEKVFAETGKVSPAMASEWETKARARAEADSSARMVNHGKVNIGGGKYMDQSEVEAIAAARVQPTLDEITEKAEAQRAKDEQLRQEAEERKRIAEEKAQIEKERNSKTKDDWRRFKDEEKREQRAKKDEEKAKRAEEKRLRDEEKRKSKGPPILEKSGAEVDAEGEATKSSFTPLDPIPKLEPISTEDEATTGPSIVPSSPEDVETTTSKVEPILIEDAEHTELKTLSNKVEIAQRVFSAPVIDDSDTMTSPPLSSEEPRTDTAVDKYTKPAAEPTAESTAEPNPTISATEASAPATRIEPMSTRIAPPASIELSAKDTTSKDTLSPPSSPTKAESGKGLSSWLKTKFSRSGKGKVTKSSPEAPLEVSEPTNTIPAKPSSTDDAAIAPAETADTTTTPGAFSAREVAMAGRDSFEQTQSHPTPLTSHPVVSRSRSTSISSLSSDEPTATTDVTATHRGRSRSIRLARTGSTDDGYGDGYVVRAHRSEETEGDAVTDESGEEEFGDARELPLPSFVREGEGRLGESPVRDSRFVEDL